MEVVEETPLWCKAMQAYPEARFINLMNFIIINKEYDNNAFTVSSLTNKCNSQQL